MEIDKALKKHLERKQRREQKERAELKQNEFFMSEALKCPRAIYLSRKYPKAPDSCLLKVFEVGNLIHGLIQKLFGEVEIEQPAELKVAGMRIRGRADCIRKNKVYELKSVANLKYIDKPSPHHLAQINLYLKAFRKTAGEIAYIEKNKLNIKQFQVKFDSRIYEKTIQNFLRVYRALKSRQIPPRLKDYKGTKENNYKICWHCKYCNMLPECNKEKGGGKKREFKEITGGIKEIV